MDPFTESQIHKGFETLEKCISAEIIYRVLLCNLEFRYVPFTSIGWDFKNIRTPLRGTSNTQTALGLGGNGGGEEQWNI